MAELELKGLQHRLVMLILVLQYHAEDVTVSDKRIPAVEIQLPKALEHGAADPL